MAKYQRQEQKSHCKLINSIMSNVIIKKTKKVESRIKKLRFRKESVHIVY